MLNIIQLADITQHISSMKEGQMKDLLSQLLSEYEDYILIGTIEQCREYRKYLSMPPLEYINNVNENIRTLVKAAADEYEYQIKNLEAELAKKSKRKKSKRGENNE